MLNTGTLHDNIIYMTQVHDYMDDSLSDLIVWPGLQPRYRIWKRGVVPSTRNQSMVLLRISLNCTIRRILEAIKSTSVFTTQLYLCRLIKKDCQPIYYKALYHIVHNKCHKINMVPGQGIQQQMPSQLCTTNSTGRERDHVTSILAIDIKDAFGYGEKSLNQMECWKLPSSVTRWTSFFLRRSFPSSGHLINEGTSNPTQYGFLRSPLRKVGSTSCTTSRLVIV